MKNRFFIKIALCFIVLFFSNNKIKADAYWTIDKILCGLSQSDNLPIWFDYQKYRNLNLSNINICDYIQIKSDTNGGVIMPNLDTCLGIYYLSYLNFKHYDLSIIDTLMTFEKDSSYCDLIRNFYFNPAQSYPLFKLISYKYIASLILIKNYFSPRLRYYIEIPGFENDVRLFYRPVILRQDSLYLPNFSSLIKWYNEGKRKSNFNFKKEFEAFSDYQWYK